MTEQSNLETPSLPPLLDETTVYRAASYKKWIDPDTGEFLPIAFQLRILKHPDGTTSQEKELSLSYNCSVQHVLTQVLRECYGASESQTGTIRTIEIDVVPKIELDVVPDTDIHALITGLPHILDDRDAATDFATALADIFRRKYPE